MVVNSGYIFGGSVCGFPSFNCVGGGWSDVCAIVGVVGLLGLRFPSSTFCKAEFVDMYCLFKSAFVMEYLIFSINDERKLAVYISLLLYPWSFSVCSVFI